MAAFEGAAWVIMLPGLSLPCEETEWARLLDCSPAWAGASWERELQVSFGCDEVEWTWLLEELSSSLGGALWATGLPDCSGCEQTEWATLLEPSFN